ncbi:MAG: phosphoglycolate phosphatase [Proteobacteria bacterium]|jgi:phosphoglycolate phosphatase|nr:phosphoglycolate phosphatase [Pseudomonadota bacterium]
MRRPAERPGAVVFDLDGTLVDSVPDLAAAVNAMLADLGCAGLSQRLIGSLIGGGVDRLVSRALAESGYAPAGSGMPEQAMQSFTRYYSARLFDRSRLYPGVIEGLDALAALGVGLGVATNKAGIFTRPLLAAAGLGGRFAVVLCADREEDRKPAPVLLEAAARGLGLPAGRVLYVGDSAVDAAAARAAGCPVALVDYGYNGGRLVADAGPDWVVGSIADVAAIIGSAGTAGIVGPASC